MNIVITAGGTSEAIDKVRKITNMSKGTLGKHIAFEMGYQKEIEKIYFLSSFSEEMERDKKHYTYPGKIECIQTSSVKSVYDQLHELLTTKKIDTVIHAMAVSDYTVDYVCNLEDMVTEVLKFAKEQMLKTPLAFQNDEISHAEFLNAMDIVQKGAFRLDTGSKMSSKSENPLIKLKPTEKIISFIKEWSPSTTLVGFKLLENVTKEELVKVASTLRDKNKADFVFANDIRLIRESGHQGYLLTPIGEVYYKGLENIAKGITDHVIAKHILDKAERDRNV